MKKMFRGMAVAALAAAAIGAGAATPVEKHGQLRVEGTQLVDAHGQPVQLRGVSMGWHNMWPRFYNGGTVDRLTGDWGADVVRCSVGVAHLDSGFDCDSVAAYAVVDSIVQGAVRNGAYVLVDFHSHPNKLADAKRFFTHVAGKYGKLPNVMYEIWNEPTEVAWSECKAYAEELVPVIRALAPEAVVVVPTPRWDQEVDKAAEDQIKGIDNLLYSLHYYATTHTQWLRDKADYARSLGLPLIMSECASMEHTGDGVIDPKEWDEWMQYADRNGISWIAWSISDKDETCSMLRPSAASDGREWKDSDLKPWAVLVKHYLKRNR
ncbi:MAG: glycoside hydrolase family 5 protein [Muribaculaceae bacterium]|nr:glycoside hydrolase family 5 protein [Muribaculaceae bacterium]MDE6485882.1 glycoside hydrolase family 5 protein [Muribaculaceae bacterium]